MTHRTRTALRAMTGGMWLASIFATTPWGDFIDTDSKRLLIGMAVTCTMSITCRRANRPADEVYEAGKMMGRAELLAEQQAPNVVPIAKIAAIGPRPRLRAADRLR